MDAAEKGEQAKALFTGGCNCSQAVFCAFADDLGVDRELALKLSSGLGGGMGRLREVCGAFSGAVLALGMKYGPDRAEVYAKVQELAAAVKAETGSIVCRELLDGTGATSGGAPEARTGEYYRKRPCAEIVRLVAEKLAELPA